MIQLQDLNDYFSSVSPESNFQCNLGQLGGFINFTNSGQRGLKEFTVSLKSILTGLQDIVDNINAFENYSNKYGWIIHIPKFAYTTDNAAMVAISGYYKFIDKEFTTPDVVPYARVSI